MRPPSLDKNRWLAPALGLVLALVVALVMVWPIAVVPGWPHSHEYAAPFERVEAFRRAFLAFDFFPTWTPFCFNGHGSPSPLIYHRLFNAVGGLLAVPFGTELGTRLALVGFAWLGVVGFYRLLRRLEVRPVLALLVAAAFLWSPYSLTDWLVRGSFAEFALLMVLPWLFETMVRQMSGERVWLPLGVWLALLLHAHQSVGLYVAVLPAVSTALALLWARRDRLALLLDAVKAGALALGLTLPWLVPVLRVGGAFRLDALKMYVPWGQYVAWHRYLVDPEFGWGRTFQDFSVELSRWLLAALLVGLLAVLVSGARTRRPRELFFFLGVLVAATCLQLELATSFYQRIPRGELLQFPWRLLGVMTPAAAVLLGLLLEALAARARLWTALAVALAAWVAFEHGALLRRAQQLSYQRFTEPDLRGRLTELDGPWSASEYLPAAIPQAPARMPWVQAEGCVVQRVSPAEPAHFRSLEVELAPAATPCRLLFSQFSTPLLAVEGDGRQQAGPFVMVEVPAGGKRVVLRRRSLIELWFP